MKNIQFILRAAFFVAFLSPFQQSTHAMISYENYQIPLTTTFHHRDEIQKIQKYLSTSQKIAYEELEEIVLARFFEADDMPPTNVTTLINLSDNSRAHFIAACTAFQNQHTKGFTVGSLLNFLKEEFEKALDATIISDDEAYNAQEEEFEAALDATIKSEDDVTDDLDCDDSYQDSYHSRTPSNLSFCLLADFLALEACDKDVQLSINTSITVHASSDDDNVYNPKLVNKDQYRNLKREKALRRKALLTRVRRGLHIAQRKTRLQEREKKQSVDLTREVANFYADESAY